MTEYREDFPVGSLVQVQPRSFLEEFRATWRYHNPLQEHQLACASATARVKSTTVATFSMSWRAHQAPGTRRVYGRLDVPRAQGAHLA